jgi:YesN/AraC family two-component response regulator
MNQVIFNEFFLLQYFRKKDASFINLKKKLDITENDLNNFINSNTQLDFNDFINKHRVELFLEFAKDVQYTNYTIDALAQEVGFSSRHHLYKPFKKFHGGTPSDYINSVTD